MNDVPTVIVTEDSPHLVETAGSYGPPGPGLEFDVLGDQVGVRVEGETAYSYTDPLTGPQGPTDYAQLTNVPTEFPPAAHNQAIGTIVGLQGALDAKQATSAKGQAGGYAGLDAGGKVPAAQVPAGEAPAYGYAEKTDTASTTSSSYVDTGLSVSITPKRSDSKIFIMATLSCGTNSSAGPPFILTDSLDAALVEGVSGSPNCHFSASPGFGTDLATAHGSVLIDAQDTSARTYKVRWQGVFDGSYLNRTQGGSGQRGVSTLVAMEIFQ